MTTTDVAIVGAGPAGIAAAIQLARYGIEPVLLEKGRVGGLLRNAHLVENYPGFPGGISGPDLVRLFEQHLSAAHVEVIKSEVTALDHEGGAFILETAQGSIRARTVIVASGTRALEMDALVLPEAAADRIFSEVYPLRDTVDATIAIVGAGDAAFDYALNLAARNEVVILNRGTKTRCLPLLYERVSLSSRITYREETRLTDVAVDPDGGLLLTCGGERLTPDDDRPTREGERLMCDGERLTCDMEPPIHADYLVIAIGREPDDGFISGRLRRGVPETEAAESAGPEGLIFAGDVRNGIFRQTAIAVGQGVHAAMRVARELGGKAR